MNYVFDGLRVIGKVYRYEEEASSMPAKRRHLFLFLIGIVVNNNARLLTVVRRTINTVKKHCCASVKKICNRQ